MNASDLAAMFMLGLLGSGHCIGMCGPLVFALPGGTGRFRPHLYYHAGRTLTYITIGAAVGLLGAGLAGAADAPLWVDRISAGLRLAAALFLAVFGLARMGVLAEPGWLSAASPRRMPGVHRLIMNPRAAGKPPAMFYAGLVLGFLPCGLSFAAFARVLPAGGPLPAAAGLLAFSAGTAPALLLLGTGASGLFRRYRRPSDILAGLLMLYMAFRLAYKSVVFILG